MTADAPGPRPRMRVTTRLVMLIAIYLLLGNFLEWGPVGFTIGFLLAVIPVPIYVALALWIDRYEPEPHHMLLTAFVWGATVSVLFAGIANSSFEGSLVARLGQEGAGKAAAMYSAPVVEETLKALVLLAFFARQRAEFDNMTDGIVYACMVGLGFAMTENIQYYGDAGRKGLEGAIGTFIGRGILAPFAHPFFTGFTGAGLGLARETTKPALKVIAPVAGFGLAMAFHHIWNRAAGTGAFVGTYFLLMVPTFLAMLLVVRYSLGREGRIIRAHLIPFVDRGALTPEELESLCSIRGRRRNAWRAFWSGGVQGWRRWRHYHAAASELAFHRWRCDRDGVPHPPSAEEEEAAHLRRLWEVRQAVRTG
jgi:RsiW-degrading membrane proteinase PrsW (M82 family)